MDFVINGKKENLCYIPNKLDRCKTLLNGETKPNIFSYYPICMKTLRTSYIVRSMKVIIFQFFINLHSLHSCIVFGIIAAIRIISSDL